MSDEKVDLAERVLVAWREALERGSTSIGDLSPGLSDEEIAGLEQELKLSEDGLPEELRRYLSVCGNGGVSSKYPMLSRSLWDKPFPATYASKPFPFFRAVIVDKNAADSYQGLSHDDPRNDVGAAIEPSLRDIYSVSNFRGDEADVSPVQGTLPLDGKHILVLNGPQRGRVWGIETTMGEWLEPLEVSQEGRLVPMSASLRPFEGSPGARWATFDDYLHLIILPFIQSSV